MKKKSMFLVVAALLLAMIASVAVAADAPTAAAASSVLNGVENGVGKTISSVMGKLQGIALLWLSSFVMIQFVITNIGLLKSGSDLEAVIGKLMGSLAWFGFCFYCVSNGPAFVNKVGSSFFSAVSTLGITYDAGALIDQAVTFGANLITCVQHAAGITDFGTVMIAGLCAIFILLVMTLIALKVLLMKIELGLVVMISPLSFAFLGLNALKDQGIAPFKSLISLLYRVVILGVLISALDIITSEGAKSITSLYDNADWFSKFTGSTGIWPILFNITVSYLIIGFLVFKSDSIAASLSSGSTNLGTSDVATAAAIGAAVGGAIATGGASLAGGKGPQAMGDFMSKAFGGDGVGVSNATPDVGSGGIGTPPSKSDSPSLSNPGASSESAPTQDVDSGEMAVDSGTAATTASEGAASPAFGGVPNRLPEHVEAEKSKSERDAARDARRQEKAGGTSTAGIGGTGDAPSRSAKTFGDHLSNLNHYVAQEKAAVHVSVNAHHE